MSRKLVLSLSLILLSSMVASTVTPQLEEQMEEEQLTEVLITFNETPEENFVSELDENYSVEKEFELVDGAKLELSSKEIEELESEQSVQRIEPDYMVETLIHETYTDLGVEKPQKHGYKGENISVAVLDTGVYDHSDLNIEESKDFTGEGEGDLNGHGTHVAGIIASKNPYYRGISSEADIYDVKVLNQTGRGTTSQILEGLEWVDNENLDIASVSIGAEIDRCDGRDLLSRAVDKTSNSGTFVVAAAGNSGPENNTITTPGCASEALTVGSVDKTGSIAPYSSRGPTGDRNGKPDVVAPGSDIVSTSLDDGFRYSSGTSMAAPHVSGQAALLLSKDSMSNEKLRNTITSTSRDLGYPKNYQGHGGIDVAASFELNQSISPYETSDKNVWTRLREFLHNNLLRIFS